MPNSKEITCIILINKSKLFGKTLAFSLKNNFPSILILGTYQEAIKAYNLLGTNRIDLLIIDTFLEEEEEEPTSNIINNFKEFYPNLFVIGLVSDSSLESIKAICKARTNKLIFKHLESFIPDLLKTISIQFNLYDKRI